MPRAKTKATQALTKLPLEDTLPSGPKPARKGNTALPSETGLGSMAYSDKIMGPLFAQPLQKKGEKGRDKWANTALVLVYRALKAAQTYGKKDFNSLYRLVLSAGIAFDKAWPQQQQPLNGNLVVQLFGSLGPDTARAILEPPHPVIDVIPQVELGSGEDVSNNSEVEPVAAAPGDPIIISPPVGTNLRAFPGGSGGASTPTIATNSEPLDENS